VFPVLIPVSLRIMESIGVIVSTADMTDGRREQKRGFHAIATERLNDFRKFTGTVSTSELNEEVVV